jgi:hypothetical protein
VIATSAGSTLPEFVRLYFQREGHAFLQAIFLACVADGQISQSEWDYLFRVTSQLGLSAEEMLAAIGLQSRQFVDRVLQEAKADGVITQQEQDSLLWLLHNLRLPADYCNYVLREIERVNAPPPSLTVQPPPRRAAHASCVDIPPKGRYAIDVVGESKYQHELSRLCGGKQRDSVDLCFPAILYLEDHNPYDDHAVRIDIHGDTVGYLSRETARRFRRWLKRNGHIAKAAQCHANIRGGWHRGPDDEGHFGVFLDLPLRDV